ncbi:MAG: lipocalin family protein [Bacteroidota bacterium]
MKRLITLGLLVLISVSTSFTQKIEDKKLIGKWKYTSSYTKNVGHEPDTWTTIVAADTVKYVEFKKNGKIGGDYFLNSRYKVNGNDRLTIISSKNNTEEFIYRIDDKRLIINYRNCDEGCSISFTKIK